MLEHRAQVGRRVRLKKSYDDRPEGATGAIVRIYQGVDGENRFTVKWDTEMQGLLEETDFFGHFMKYLEEVK